MSRSLSGLHVQPPGIPSGAVGCVWLGVAYKVARTIRAASAGVGAEQLSYETKKTHETTKLPAVFGHAYTPCGNFNFTILPCRFS